MRKRRVILGRKLESDSGFSLIEILVGILGVVVLIVAFFQLLGSNAAISMLTDQRLEAVAAAQELMDRLTVEVIAAINADEDATDISKKVDSGTSKDEYDDLFTSSEDGVFYHIGEHTQSVEGLSPVSGYKITVVAYYGGGKHSVMIDYFIEHQSR